MGYTCPVCGAPQADGRHLADHLAVTAMVHGDDHESWLEAHAPGWAELNPAELAPIVVEHAAQTDYPQVFEDTTDDHDHGHHRHDSAQGRDQDDAPSLEDHVARAGRRGPGAGRGDLSAEQRAIIDEAREMTEEMLDADGEDQESGDEADGPRDG